jgi:hypothetical protein
VVRAREAIPGDLMRARQRLSKLLLRHGVRYEDTASSSTIRHRSWLTSLDLGHRGPQVTLLEYLRAIDAIVIRPDPLERSSPTRSPARRGRRSGPGRDVCAGSERSPPSVVRRGRRPRTARARREPDELHRLIPCEVISGGGQRRPD